MIELSDDARAFLRDWLDWVERGAPENSPYNRSWGLCSNSKLFMIHLGVEFKDFFETFYGSRYPFGGNFDYDMRADARTMDLCPQRLAFAREHAAERVA